MNIWLLTTSYNAIAQNGMNTYLQQAAQMYAENGHSVSIFTKSQSTDKVTTKTHNLIVHYFNFSPTLDTPSTDTFLAEAYALDQYLCTKLENQTPDFIEVQDATALGYYVILRKLRGDQRLAKVPIIIHLHMPCFITAGFDQKLYPKKTLSIALAERFTLRTADGFFCPSNFLYAQLKPYLRETVPAAIIPYPFKPNPTIKSLPKDIDLLYLGRDEFRKGLKDFLKVCAKLWDSGYQFSLTIVSTPVLSRNIYSLFNARCTAYENKGLLHSIPEVPQHMVKEIMLKAKWIVVPSYFDNFPMTCLEAMSIKTPLFISANGGQAEIAPTADDGGIMFDWSIPGDCEIKLKRLLAYTEKDRRDLGEKAYLRLEKICNFSENIQKRIKHVEECKQNLSPLNLFPLATTKTSQRTFSRKNTESFSIIEEHAQQNLFEKIEKLRTDYIIIIPESYTITETFIKTAQKTFQLFTNLGYIYSWTGSKQDPEIIITSSIPEPPLALYNSPIISPIMLNREALLSLDQPQDMNAEEFIWSTVLNLFLAGIPGLCIPQILCHTSKTTHSCQPITIKNIQNKFRTLYEKNIYNMV